MEAPDSLNIMKSITGQIACHAVTRASLTDTSKKRVYTGSAAGHHLVKVFSSANRQVRGDTSFLGGSIARTRVLTRPVTRRMRRRVSISFCPRRLSRSTIVESPTRGSYRFDDRFRGFLIVSYHVALVPNPAWTSVRKDNYRVTASRSFTVMAE